MSREARRLRRASLGALALFAFHALASRVLLELGLIESLLAPDGGRAALALVVALLFFAARLWLLFVAPGLILAALASLLLARFGRRVSERS